MAAVLTLTACASSGNQDPWEGLNRFFFGLNKVLDSIIAQPLSELYVAIVPKPVRDVVRNFFDNLGYINVIVNGLLQGKFDQALSDSGRMLVNSTLGLAGFLDVATGLGLERHEEDFGLTLAAWGVEQGPYLVLPVLGPTTTRDMWSVPVAVGTNPLVYVNFGVAVVAVGGFRMVDERAQADEQLRRIEQEALDPYVYTREAYLAHRAFLVNEGVVPETLDGDLYEDFGDEEPDEQGGSPGAGLLQPQ
jgi:phospholipid-binding lipoprotein MlaA